MYGEEVLQVNCMKQLGKKNAFAWPNKLDSIFYHHNLIFCRISETKPCSQFATLLKYNWLMYNEV